MSNIFVFGIGGTGSRVVRSLVHLLASGVNMPNSKTVVPILIDPDAGNGDTNRTAQLIDWYQETRNKIHNPTKFFKTEIKTLNQLGNNQDFVRQNLFFSLSSQDQHKFDEFIGRSTMTDASQNLMELLYSKKDLASNMDVGFKGRPNIGSVVLNKIITAPEWNTFTQLFNAGDSIFIISSIFGGTGAAGFPLLLKNLRNPNMNNAGVVNNAVIGAISYMPYFKLSRPLDEDADFIDSSTFMSKAKAALGYYGNSIFSSNDKLEFFYHLGDLNNTSYENNPGNKAQKNNANFLELAGAISITDFDKHRLKVNAGDRTVIKEFGVNEPNDNLLKFGHLDTEHKELIEGALTKMKWFTDYMDLAYSDHSNSITRWSVFLKEALTEFSSSALQKFLRDHRDWTNELEQFSPAWSPFATVNKSNVLGSNSAYLSGGKEKSANDITKKMNMYLMKSGQQITKNSDIGQFVELIGEALNSVKL